MNRIRRAITKDAYDRAQARNGYLTSADKMEVFGEELCCGRGVYFATVYERGGEYYTVAEIGGSSD